MSIEQRLSEVLKEKAVSVGSATDMPANVRRGYRRRLFLHVALAVTVLAVVSSGSVLAFSTLRTDDQDIADQDRALVPPGEVVRRVGLWKGTSETSIEGHRVRVELRVEPGETPGDPPKAILVNTGEQPIGYGYGISLARRKFGSWEPVRNVSMVPGIGLGLEPEASSEPEVLTVTYRLSGPVRLLPPGEYRVTKDVQPSKNGPWISGNRPPPFKVSARFIVSEEAGEKELTFPVQENSADVMDALITGKLVERDGCLYIDAGGRSTSPIWPHGFSYDRDGDAVTILDDKGTPVARTGEEVSMGGGLIGEPESPLSDDLAKKVGDCEAPYWVVGELN